MFSESTAWLPTHSATTPTPVYALPMDIPEGWEGLDAGPDTRKLFTKRYPRFQNNPLERSCGVFEFDNFTAGSRAIADAVVEATKDGAFSRRRRRFRCLRQQVRSGRRSFLRFDRRRRPCLKLSKARFSPALPPSRADLQNFKA